MTLEKIEQNAKGIIEAMYKYESEKQKGKKKELESLIKKLGSEINTLLEEEKKNAS